MAIYHLNVRGVAPARGSSPIAVAAYQSGERLSDPLTGEWRDYSRKERVAATGIEAPADAPAWAHDRQGLWSHAAEAWSGGDRRALAARRIIVALPRELSPERQRECVTALCRRMTARGYACDWAIHDSGDGNPHAHILATALSLGPEGFAPAPKRTRGVKSYLCRRGDEETLIPATNWKSVKADGWEKVYRWTLPDGSQARLTRTEATARGLSLADRASKSPVATVRKEDGGYSVDDARAELRLLRAAWADIANARLAEQARADGTAAATIDARSYAERGVARVPTVHEGPAVTAQERRSGAEAPATDVRAHNNEIRAKNALMDRLEGIVRGLREEIRRMRRSRALAPVMDGLAPALSDHPSPRRTSPAATVAAAVTAQLAYLARTHDERTNHGKFER